MVFAVFDQDSLTEAMRRVWDKISPPAMFTAAGNLSQRGSENFLNAIDMVRWNVTAQEAMQESHNGDFGYSGTSAVTASTNTPGSNNKPVFDGTDVVGWTDSSDMIRVPAGFTPIRGNNVLYADTLPPFDCTLTFNNNVA